MTRSPFLHFHATVTPHEVQAEEDTNVEEECLCGRILVVPRRPVTP